MKANKHAHTHTEVIWSLRRVLAFWSSSLNVFQEQLVLLFGSQAVKIWQIFDGKLLLDFVSLYQAVLMSMLFTEVFLFYPTVLFYNWIQ